MNQYLRSFFFASLFITIASAAFSQSAFITNRGDSSVSVINIQTNNVVAVIPVHPNPSGIVVSPDGLKAYVGYYTSTNNAVTVISTITNSVIGNIPLNGGSSFGGVIDVSPDGSKVYVACKDTVFVIDAVTFTITAKILSEKNNYIQGIAISHNGLNVYVNGSEKIIIIDALTNTVSSTIPVKGAYFFQLAISPDDTKLYGADKLSGSLHIIYLSTKTSVTLPLGTDKTNCVCVSPDGSRVYATNYTDNSVSIIDGSIDTIVTKIPVSGINPFGISITPDGSRLYVADFVTNNVSVISTLSNTEISMLSVGKNPAAVGKFIGGNSLLPLKLISFGASLLNSDAILKWQTGTEQNTSFFSIERSTDGIHFTVIGNMKAAGYSNTVHNYQYNDKGVTNLVNNKAFYYRLLTNSQDGTSSLSNTIKVNLPVSLVKLLLFPNPVFNSFNVTINGYQGVATVSIIDLTGKKLYQQKIVTDNGNFVVINTSSLSAGTYILRVITDKKMEQKFIKN